MDASHGRKPFTSIAIAWNLVKRKKNQSVQPDLYPRPMSYCGGMGKKEEEEKKKEKGLTSSPQQSKFVQLVVTASGHAVPWL